jgi:NAD(P)-dependent dehydrogenase (short-subunit alcohol dehydrogenase family)
MNIEERFGLRDKRAIVTGAGRGIGRTLALALAEAGCDIGIIELDREDAAGTAAEVAALGRRAFTAGADVTVKAAVTAAFEALVGSLGGLDILVNNAGACIHEAFEDIPEEHYNRVMDTNLKGVFLCCQAAAKYLLPQKRGSIVNIASMSGTIANWPQKQAPYNASKAGVILLTKSLAVEWAPQGVRVNCTSPGYTATEMTLMAKNLFPTWEALIPMGRLADPEELAGAVIYLASDAASYTTGTDIIIDGGFTSR